MTAARRANEEVNAADKLWLDRRAAAHAIIGITKGARRRKDSLTREGDEFEGRTDSARFDLEQKLIRLTSSIMGAELPSATEIVVRLASGFPGNVGMPETDADLAALEGILSSTEARPLCLEALDGSKRAERHRDGVCIYKSSSLEATTGDVWLQSEFVAWTSPVTVECIDGTVAFTNKHGERLASVYPRNEAGVARVFAWMRQERPELRDAERAMTSGEAIGFPGCMLALVLMVGGVISGALHLFGAGMGWVGGAAALTGLLAALAITSGVRRFVNRPIVRQLVGPGAAADAPALSAHPDPA